MKFTVALSFVALSSPATAFQPISNVGRAPASSSLYGTPDEFCVGILGDLHIDPRVMEDYESGREQWVNILEDAKKNIGEEQVSLVSLGDLGESKSVRPDETSELFAGTTECHELAADFLSGFGVPYDVVGGNHDLEGIDEFDTDEANLELFLRAHKKDGPQFCRKIADKTLLVGMTSTIFREAKYTSHEVTIDQDQIDWFENLVETHSADDGWKIFVFTHAPPNGSGLRVLQENHVVNGCCWLNHSNEAQCRKFIELVREHRCIKGWFSGHFHLGQDYQDSITFPTIDPKDGPYPNRGSCVFAQTSVMRSGTSRDGRQQSRLLRGNKDGFEICTVDHQKGGTIRLDATITYRDNDNEVGVYAHSDIEKLDDKYFKVYSPSAGDSLHPPDENYIPYEDELIMEEPVSMDTKAWWKMACGRVIGMLNGNMIEYDRSTLAPLGLIVGADELIGKRVAIVDSGLDEGMCAVDFEEPEEGMEGADCGEAEAREQAVLLVDDNDGSIVVVQPNEDGSYWRKIVRNKMIRMKEVRREKAAKRLAATIAKDDADVVSSWGPYTTTKGTAKNTGVSGLTAPAAK